MAEQGALYRIELDTKDLKRQAEEVSKTIHGIGTNAEKEGNRIDGVFKKLGAAMAGYFTAQQAISFAQSIIKVRSEIESLEVSFRTLLGSEAKATALFGQIREFAVNTPMMMNDLSKGAQTLLAFNYNADKVMPTLKALGDISMGDSNKFNSLTLAFAQMSSAGKLMGQDLMQMINAGFNPLAEISAKTGKSIGQLKDEMSKGAISAKMVEEAFISATSEGGKFYGMLEAQSKTMAGAISNLQGAWEDMLNAIGEESQDVFTDTVSVITKIVKNYEEFGKVIVDVIAVFGAYKAAVLLVAAAEKIRYQATLAQMAGMTKMQAVTTILTEKTELLNKTLLKNPYALVAAAAVTLGIAMYKIISNAGKLSQSMQAVENTSVNLNKEIVKEQLNIDSLFIKLKNAKQGTDEYKEAKKNILDNYGGYLKGLSKELTSLQDIEGAYKAITKAATDSAKARAAASAKENVFNIAAENSGDVRVKLEKMIRDSYKGQKTDKGRDTATYVWSELEKVLNTGNYDELYKGNLSKLLAKVRKDNINIFGIDKFNNLINELKRIDAERDAALNKIDVKFGKAVAESETKVEEPKEFETEEERKKKWEKQNKIEERLRKIEEYKKKVADAQRDAEFEITQAKIDAMEEGLPKVMAQNELNYQKALADNVDREKAMLEEYRDRMQAEWENANPEFKSKNLHFDRNAITKLPADEVQILYNYSDLACEAFDKANKDALKSALNDFKTYEQQRLEIATKYTTLINALYEEDGNGGKRLRQGVTQDNINNITRQMNLELSELSDVIMKNSTDYIKFFSASLTMCVDDVVAIGNTIKQELNTQLENGKLTVDEYKRSWDEVEAVIDNVRNQYSDFVVFMKDGIQGLIDKNKELAEAKKAAALVDYAEASKNGDINGMNSAQAEINAADKVLSAASSVSKTIALMNAIVDAFNNAVNGISTGINALASLADSFGVDIDSADSTWGKLLTATEILQASSQAFTDAFKSLLSGDIFGFIGNLIKSVTVIIQKINEAYDKALYEDIEKQKTLVEDLEKAYSKLEKQVSKTYGANKEAVLTEQKSLIQQRIDAYNQMIADEEEKKNTDQSAIDEYSNKISELEEQLSELGEDISRVLFDSDIYSEISSFGDALADAFMNGEDAAEAFANAARDLTRQALNNIIKQFIQSAGYIEQIEARINEAYSDGVLSQDEIDSIVALSESLANDFQSRYGWIEDVYNNLSDSELSATKGKGITTASQESVDEMNGRVTVIQGHTYELANNSRILVNNTTDILRSVRNIENFASDIKQKVVDIEAETKDMKRAINDFEIRGINLK